MIRACRHIWRRSGILVVAAILLASVGPAHAHPLGTFTINHHMTITVASDHLSLSYVLDFAEVPTFQEVGQFDEPGMRRHLGTKVETWVGGLRLTSSGVAVPLALVAARIACVAGEGGLPTLRIEADLLPDTSGVPRGPDGTVEFTYRDGNYADRLGWKEVNVAGPALVSSSAPAVDRGTNRLRIYPADLAKTPPTDTGATFHAKVLPAMQSTRPAAASVAYDLMACRRSAGAGTVRSSSSRPPSGDTSGFGNLFGQLSAGPLSTRTLAIALVGAFVIGAYHALTPGHGKTILAAYFIGTRGTPGQALLLGAVTTLTHTTGVFLLGFVALIASRYILPERVYPILSLLSGMMLLAVGVSLFTSRMRAARGAVQPHHHAHGDHHHHHDHSHDHGFGHHHHHLPPPDAIRLRDLVALGITGGLLPCPSALIVMLAAISVGRVGLGLLLITAFSVGLAAVLTAGGLLMVYARSFMTRLIEGGASGRSPSARRLIVGYALRRLPVVSAAFVAILGLVLITQTVLSIGQAR